MSRRPSRQETIDGPLAGIGVFTPFAYCSTTKYVNETSHAFTFDYAAISKRWFDTLPADLQAMVLATAEDIGTIADPWEIDFLAQQRKIWVEKGDEIDVLSPRTRTR